MQITSYLWWSQRAFLLSLLSWLMSYNLLTLIMTANYDVELILKYLWFDLCRLNYERLHWIKYFYHDRWVLKEAEMSESVIVKPWSMLQRQDYFKFHADKKLLLSFRLSLYVFLQISVKRKRLRIFQTKQNVSHAELNCFAMWTKMLRKIESIRNANTCECDWAFLISMNFCEMKLKAQL